MINLDLRATYDGMACAEVVKTVQALRSMGFSDEEINEMLDKNKMERGGLTMDEYIEKKELREWVESWFAMDRHYHPYAKSNNIPTTELYDILERIPSAAVVPLEDYRSMERTVNKLNKALERAVPVVHGHWEKIEIIDDDSDSGVNDEAARCSVCEGVQSSYYWATNYYNYCPNCGAKMDEEDQKMPDVEKYIELMKDAVETSRENEEKGHNMADGILCDFLTELGYEDLVKEWDNVKKWYA